MILSEYDRRWAEIRFYRFCMETYAIRRKSIDILDYADLVCRIANIEPNSIKALIRTMLNDTYYTPSNREIICIGNAKGYSCGYIAKNIGLTRQGVYKYIKENEELFTPLPRCGLEEDQEIIKFLEALDKLKEIGNLGHGTTD